MADEQLHDLLRNKPLKNLKAVIAQAVTLLTVYGNDRNLNLVAIDALEPTLDRLLSKFYAEVRKVDGLFYWKNDLLAICYGLQKHFLVKGADIINDPCFLSSSNMFSTICVNLKQKGKGTVQHKEHLTTEHFQELYFSHLLYISNPNGLQNKVFVEKMVHLCNRGYENLRDMTRGDFYTLNDSGAKDMFAYQTR